MLAEPKDGDLMIFAVIVGGMAPIVSVMVSSTLVSSFSGFVTQSAYSAQNHGVNAGLTTAAASNNNLKSNKGNRGGGNK